MKDKSESIQDVELVEKLHSKIKNVKSEIAKRIVGQDEIIDQLLISLFARGHCLLVGVPGLAKTLLIKTVAEVMDLKFSRIQFTPDLMPSDITGTEILEEDQATKKREFKFIAGPIFANIVLADEINRTPPKTQADHRAAANKQGTRKQDCPLDFRRTVACVVVLFHAGVCFAGCGWRHSSTAGAVKPVFSAAYHYCRWGIIVRFCPAGQAMRHVSSADAEPGNKRSKNEQYFRVYG